MSQFFEYHETSEEERITVASFYLDGAALAWYQWMYRNSQIHSWTQFLQALETRFASTAYDDPRGKLFKLTQTSSVAIYLSEFEALANRIVGLPAPFLLSCFVSGLKPDIRREALALQPSSLSQAADLARLNEEKIQDLLCHNRPLPFQPWTPPAVSRTFTPPPRSLHEPMLVRSLPPLLPAPPTNPRFKQLSEAAMAEHREKGPCFHCVQKWSRNHKCKGRFLLLVAEEDDDSAVTGADLPTDDPGGGPLDFYMGEEAQSARLASMPWLGPVLLRPFG